MGDPVEIADGGPGCHHFNVRNLVSGMLVIGWFEVCSYAEACTDCGRVRSPGEREWREPRPEDVRGAG